MTIDTMMIACLRPNTLSERTTIWVTRLFAGLIGTFLLVFGLWYQIPDTAFQYLFITGAMYTAGALGCVAAGVYWRKANTAGAVIWLIVLAISTATFFIVAAIVSVRGFHDLLDLLRVTEPRHDDTDEHV